ncbi:3'-5' exonuclease domain-containing protein 2 [Comamonadaceae bacterium OTU4NAUVB1]|nr:3'-5' exonuclease domain-containing protein 2 [Comamonadaceae bacterium OTU4NAUVB1]
MSDRHDTPTSPTRIQQSNRPQVPTREEIALLDVFEGLGPRDIEVVSTAPQAAGALAAVGALRVVGFDTESKPTFLKNEVSTGPHVVQFASPDRAWVFQLHDPECRAAAAHLLASSALTKVGFGLAGDRTQIRHTLGIEPQAVVDLDTVFKRRGYRNSVGVKGAVAMVFGQRFVKSRKQTTSNWAARHLSEGQVCYAANDAYAALRVCEALGLDAPSLTPLPLSD